jgi:magnesium transporter
MIKQMFYEIINGKITERNFHDIMLSDKQQYIGFFNYEEGNDAIQKCGFNNNRLSDSPSYNAMIYENREGYDFICTGILNIKALQSQTDKVFIYLRKNMLLFVSSKISMIENNFNKITEDENVNFGFDRLLCTLFEMLTVSEVNFLEQIEQEISDLENALITTKKKDCVKEIISMRKRLMALKKYYEQLLDVLDGLQKNENEILNENELRYFKNFSSKVDRHYHNVLNLRDYLTQVREAYQAEVDIGLNNIMKIFTVITAIFMPLTLIAGWYGMNFQMPEYHWVFGYPAVIILSILVIVFCLVYFKKHKWF